MERTEIIEKLKDLKYEFDELMPLFDSPKDGMNKQESLTYISEKYSDIKSRVLDYQKALEKDERAGKLNQDEIAFLVPAIREVALHCIAARGSKDERKLVSSIYDGQDYCLHWLSELNA